MHKQLKTKEDFMPTKKYSFYIDGKLVYICYTKMMSDNHEAYLSEKGMQYELTVEVIF